VQDTVDINAATAAVVAAADSRRGHVGRVAGGSNSITKGR
jgi:hypothetical protein